MKVYLILLLTAIVTACTMVIRIPVPGTGGYLNFGDIAVIFCGLFLGRTKGAVAAGVGSAVADLIGGFYSFALITLVAKGLEGFLAGCLGRKHPLLLIPAGLSMVSIYFIAEIFMPGMGYAPALSELPFNLLQAGVGIIFGLGVFKALQKALPDKV